ncbi:MAG: hypothetical protein KBC17_00695 [Candidatus Pacebacteria bacterium]|nr:hypothetical protein [Candidatus Paceibacterota bacterium]
MEEIIKKIDQLLGNPNYALTQYNLYEGGRSVGTFDAHDAFWWVRLNQIPQVCGLLSQLLDAHYEILYESQSDIDSEPIDEFIDRFLLYLEGRADVISSIRNEIRRISTEVCTSAEEQDDQTRRAYDVKSAGYASKHLGLTPVKLAQMIGITLEKLSIELVMIAGIGTGDFAHYSFPAKRNVMGIDISTEMIKRCLYRNIMAVKGNVSDPSMFISLAKMSKETCRIVIFDYFGDITAKIVTALRNAVEFLPPNGIIVFTILIPIDQVGFDSRKNDNTSRVKLCVTNDEIIGNTGNPFSDLVLLKDVCARLSLKLKTFSITSYFQWDAGRDVDELPLEFRPSAIMVFEKVVDNSPIH